jgi:mono/diheme cytochrome c family protein
MKAVVAGVSLLCATGMVMAQGKVDFGKREYDSNCAGCHGIKGKGDGPYNPFLTSKTSSDLTTLSKKNQGVFPYQRVYEVVDGRQAVAAHGPRDMPIWGADYLVQAGAYYADMPYDPEMYVRTRIMALLDYLVRIQAK